MKPGTEKYILIEGIDIIIKELIENSKKNMVIFKNTFNDSFNKSKKLLEREIYNNSYLKQNTFYCGCEYSSDKFVDKESC